MVIMGNMVVEANQVIGFTLAHLMGKNMVIYLLEVVAGHGATVAMLTTQPKKILFWGH